ncbi:hypothetical protein LOC67_00985 [Stieleria sp. JC731]|uniref:hypothetical protein n=1 Tax=Pirellulaceae TaxID=2691357 RepID=UPI001E491B6B|nr:hypothetical protein [Stieleria sp. JC731]MCC9599115.1 hypothetical protein [Stieleria sp. JC731]
MKRYLNYSIAAICTAALTSSTVRSADAQSPAPPNEPSRQFSNENGLQSPDNEDDRVEYLTRGPLHEAFAEPFSKDPKPNPVVDREPPEPINETSPEYKPEGKNVQWISGYWAWDEDRDDFIWISGVWRDVPPNRQWVPGYWEQAPKGFRWVSGFWAKTGDREISYLPAPPESVEQGPSSPAPNDDYFYVPGNWVYQSNDYQWQPGYWAPTQPGWVWVPSQYYWTPRGCVYRHGYWDRELAYRGMMFTPVYYRQNVYSQSGYRYRPRYALDTTVSLLANLFLRPNYNRYYFGDYYGSRYSSAYYPWVSYGQRSGFYDPLFSYYSIRNPQTLNFANRYHDHFNNNRDHRPPHTIAAQQAFLKTNAGANLDSGTLRAASIAENLTRLVNDDQSEVRLQRVDPGQVTQLLSNSSPDNPREFSQRRRQFESKRDRNPNVLDGNLNGNNKENSEASASAKATLDLPVVNAQANANASANAGSNSDRQSRGQSERDKGRRPNPGNRPEIGETLPGQDSVRGQLDKDAQSAQEQLNRNREQLQQNMEKLRREGRARPERPTDWPRAIERSQTEQALPTTPRRGNSENGPSNNRPQGIERTTNRATELGNSIRSNSQSATESVQSRAQRSIENLNRGMERQRGSSAEGRARGNINVGGNSIGSSVQGALGSNGSRGSGKARGNGNQGRGKGKGKK